MILKPQKHSYHIDIRRHKYLSLHISYLVTTKLYKTDLSNNFLVILKRKKNVDVDALYELVMLNRKIGVEP